MFLFNFVKMEKGVLVLQMRIYLIAELIAKGQRIIVSFDNHADEFVLPVLDEELDV